MSERADKLLGAPERRAVAVSDFEVRSDVDELVLEGYASVFETPYPIFGGPEAGGWDEVVDRRAFDKSLAAKPDVHLLVNHEGLPLARTKSGTMDLSTDRKGLKVVARLDRSDPDVQTIAPKMRRGDLDEMSFAFRTNRHEFNEDESLRRLLEVTIHKGDVSVVNFGANDATSVQLRALAMLRELDAEAAMAELRSIDNPLDILAEARGVIDALVARLSLRPSSGGRLSVAQAESLIAAPR